jgi:hypothetical protein
MKGACAVKITRRPGADPLNRQRLVVPASLYQSIAIVAGLKTSEGKVRHECSRRAREPRKRLNFLGSYESAGGRRNRPA